jgi:DNA-binding response OmpR family regulator
MARVLILDEDAAIRDFLEEVLRDEGYSVESRRLEGHAPTLVAGQRPDLVLLDCLAPWRPDGWATLEALRADPATARLPIILCLTNPRQAEARAAWLAAQLTWVLPKPFDLDELSAVVRTALERRTTDDGRRPTADGRCVKRETD